MQGFRGILGVWVKCLMFGNVFGLLFVFPSFLSLLFALLVFFLGRDCLSLSCEASRKTNDCINVIANAR